jgi:hypothetical protein
MRDWPPRIHLGSLPEEERKIAQNIEELLWQLAYHANDFRAIVTLFDFCGDPGPERVANLPYAHLRLVAARAGAMSIYHFVKSIEAINKQIGRCPTLRVRIDHRKKRVANKLLNSRFPRFDAVRHAVAHAGELAKSPEKREVNSVEGPYNFAGIEFGKGSKIFFQNMLLDRIYANTFKGKVESYEISQATYNALVSVRVRYYDAFEAATFPIGWRTQPPAPSPRVRENQRCPPKESPQVKDDPGD